MIDIAKVMAKLIISQISGDYQVEEVKEEWVPLILELAVGNQIEVIIGKSLLTSNWNDEINHELKDKVLKGFLLSSIQKKIISEIGENFCNSAIAHQFMKGSVMKSLYLAPELRQMSDIDIIVKEEDMLRAKSIIEDNGYKLYKQESHHDIYIKAPNMCIELHRSLYDQNVDSNQYNYFGSFERSRLKEDSKYSYEFTNEDFYVYMIAHMAKHFYQMGCGVRNLIDIYVFLNAYNHELNFEYIEKQLKVNGILNFEHHMKKATYYWLGGESGNKLYDDLIEFMLDSGIYGKDENGIWNKYSKEESENSELTKRSLKIWYYFPPMYYMKKYFSWLEQYPVLLPIAWLIRAVMGILGHRGSRKRDMIERLSKDDITKMHNIYSEMNLDFKNK